MVSHTGFGHVQRMSDIKFRNNPSRGSRVSRGQTDRQTDVKLIVDFPNFANAPKNKGQYSCAVIIDDSVITYILRKVCDVIPCE